VNIVCISVALLTALWRRHSLANLLNRLLVRRVAIIFALLLLALRRTPIFNLVPIPCRQKRAWFCPIRRRRRWRRRWEVRVERRRVGLIGASERNNANPAKPIRVDMAERVVRRVGIRGPRASCKPDGIRLDIYPPRRDPAVNESPFQSRILPRERTRGGGFSAPAFLLQPPSASRVARRRNGSRPRGHARPKGLALTRHGQEHAGRMRCEPGFRLAPHP
jgi:hypothetical protein